MHESTTRQQKRTLRGEKSKESEKMTPYISTLNAVVTSSIKVSIEYLLCRSPCHRVYRDSPANALFLLDERLLSKTAVLKCRLILLSLKVGQSVIEVPTLEILLISSLLFSSSFLPFSLARVRGSRLNSYSG